MWLHDVCLYDYRDGKMKCLCLERNLSTEPQLVTIEEDVGIVEAYKGRIESDKAGIKTFDDIEIIDDDKQVTLCAASTLDKEVKTKHANIEAAKEVGALIAKRAKAKKINDVVYDRGGYIYTGVVKALAEAAREGGLNF